MEQGPGGHILPAVQQPGGPPGLPPGAVVQPPAPSHHVSGGAAPLMVLLKPHMEPNLLVEAIFRFKLFILF